MGDAGDVSDAGEVLARPSDEAETVLLKGKKRKETMAIALPDESNELDNGKIRMNKIIRTTVEIFWSFA